MREVGNQNIFPVTVSSAAEDDSVEGLLFSQAASTMLKAAGPLAGSNGDFSNTVSAQMRPYSSLMDVHCKMPPVISIIYVFA